MSWKGGTRMPEQLFLHYLAASLTTSVLVIVLYIARPRINKIYASKWKYHLWFFWLSV